MDPLGQKGPGNTIWQNPDNGWEKETIKKNISKFKMFYPQAIVKAKQTYTYQQLTANYSYSL